MWLKKALGIIMVKKLVKKIALFYKILTYILQLFCLYICCLKFKVKIT